MDERVSSKEQQSTLRWIIALCILYLFGFPFVLYIALASFMMFGHPNIPNFLAGLLASLILSVPLSICVSVFFMWWRYLQGQYSKACFHFGVPVLTAFISWILIGFFLLFI